MKKLLLILFLISLPIIGAEQEYYFDTESPETIKVNQLTFTSIKGKKRIKVPLSQKDTLPVIVSKGYPARIYLPDYLPSKIRNDAGKDNIVIDGQKNGRVINISAGNKSIIGKTRTNILVRCKNGFEIIIDVKTGNVEDSNKVITVVDRDTLGDEPNYNKSYFFRMKDIFVKEKGDLEQTMQEQFFASTKKVIFHDQHIMGDDSFFLETVVKTNNDLYINFTVPRKLKEFFKTNSIMLRLSPFKQINLAEQNKVVTHIRPSEILSYEHDKADRITLIFRDIKSIGETFNIELDINNIKIQQKVDLALQKPIQMDMFFDPTTQF